MGDDDKMIISVNSGDKFDIDFESAYKQTANETDFQYWHPCYVINEETVERQDPILGQDLVMFAVSSKYNLCNNTSSSL